MLDVRDEEYYDQVHLCFLVALTMCLSILPEAVLANG